MRKIAFLPIAAFPALMIACTPPDGEFGSDDSRGDTNIEAQESEQVLSAPEPVDPAVEEARDALSDEIARLGADFDGSLGIAVVDVGNGWSTGFGEQKLLPQQSVSKLWVTLAALELVDRGELSLDKPITVGREDLAVFHQPIRAEVLRNGAVRTDPLDLIERAITQSDNTANDVLLNQVGGPAAVRQILAAKGIDGIRFGPGERAMQSAIAGLHWRQSYAYTRQGFFDARDQVPDDVREKAFGEYLADPVDGATPLAIARALASLSRGELLSAESTRRFVEIMQETRSGPRRLKAGAPDGWTVAHKTGTGQYWDGRQSGYNDVGLVTSPDGRTYALAIMIGETRRGVPASMELMQSITRAVAAFDAEISDNVEA